MANKPNIIHFITGSRNLLMRISAPYAKAGAVLRFIRDIALKSCTKALRMIKLIIIKLRLRMMMRRIG